MYVKSGFEAAATGVTCPVEAAWSWLCDEELKGNKLHATAPWMNQLKVFVRGWSNRVTVGESCALWGNSRIRAVPGMNQLKVEVRGPQACTA